MPQNFSALDAGFGMGQHLYRMACHHRDARFYGLEADAGEVADFDDFCKRRGLDRVRLITGELPGASLPEAVDAAVCCSVLEHIEDDVQTLAWFWRNLNTQGRLLIYVPTSERRLLPALRRRLEKMTASAGTKLPHGHARYYQPEELKAKLAQAGFALTTEKVTYGWAGRLSYDLVTSIQYHRGFRWLFPFYLLLLHPLVLLLMAIDYVTPHRSGNGYLCMAQKQVL